MKCEELLRALAEYDDGAADDCLCRDVEEHIAGCPSCQTLHEDLVRVAKLCKQTPRPCIPEDLRQRISDLLKT